MEESAERNNIDRIRSATFPLGRRGYEKRDVERFLNGIADWLETGGADQTRADIVRRDLERVGEQTGKILTDAHDASENLRAEAEREAHRLAEEVAAGAEQTREAADGYAAETRAAAEADAEQTVAGAEAEAKRIIAEANRRRSDIETVISDLEARRDSVIADMERLSGELAGAATQHGPATAPEESKPASSGSTPAQRAGAG